VKATHTFTLRVPSSWQSLASTDVRAMLAAYLQRPTPNLPSDPGPGDVRLSLSLPARAVKVVSALLNENESAALRRVIAASRGLPFAAQARPLPIGRSHARVLEAEVIKPRALLPASQSQKPAWYSGSPEKWASESPETKQVLLAMMAKQTESAQPVEPSPQARASKPLFSFLWGSPQMRFFLFLALVFFGFVLFYGRARKTSEPAKPEPGPRFRPWSPS
jgi:hypothetical protein